MTSFIMGLISAPKLLQHRYQSVVSFNLGAKDLNQTCLVDGHSFTIQKAIQGHMIYQPDKENFYEIGKIYRSLHNLQVPSSLSSRMPKIDENTIGLSWNHLSEHKSVDRNLIEKFNQYKKLVLRQLDFSSKASMVLLNKYVEQYE